MSKEHILRMVREAIKSGDELHQLIKQVAPLDFFEHKQAGPLHGKLVPDLYGLDDTVSDLVQSLWVIQAEWPIVLNNPDDHDALRSFSYALDLLRNVSKQIRAVANHQPDNQS